MLTRQLYDEITRCKDHIMGCSSRKEATPYLQRLQLLNNCLTGPTRNITSSLYAMLNEYCKQDSNKEHYSQFILQDMAKLESIVKENSNRFMSVQSVQSSRILYTPSPFARTTLLHLQEVGSLQAIHPHTSTRTNLPSFLCFVVLSGNGNLTYEGVTYELSAGDCVFIDCRQAYSHSTGYSTNKENREEDTRQGDGSSCADPCTDIYAPSLWSLQWCHFYAPTLPAIYEKYKERGGSPVFRPDTLSNFTTILTNLYTLASSSDYIRDMRINESLSNLLTLLMEQSWHPESKSVSRKRLELVEIKNYLDEHYSEKIVLDDLAERYYINKYYLTKIFKEAYGNTINGYVIAKRITRAKQLLRFTDMTVDEISAAVGMGDANYFSRTFRKVEGISPREYRKQW